MSTFVVTIEVLTLKIAARQSYDGEQGDSPAPQCQVWLITLLAI